MQRLTQFDVTRQFISRRGKITAQFVFGGVCAGAMIGLRSVIDVIAPSSGPFALIYPTVLLATLYGRLRAGLTALVLTFGWVWYFVLPSPSSFSYVNPTDPARVLWTGTRTMSMSGHTPFRSGSPHGVRGTT